MVLLRFSACQKIKSSENAKNNERRETLMLQLMNSRLLYWVLLGVFCTLNLLDGHSTYQVLKPYYYHRERNPVARWVFRRMGLPQGIVVFKAIILGMLIPAMSYYAAHDPFTINIVLVVSGVVFTLVVLHNYRVYNRIKEERQR